jgi:demethylmenaquinone methyltransferase / 2-methoxy-6-polyprenyl-1,4-benzoquinol methylase
MSSTVPEPNRFARRLFAGIAPQYERMGAILSLGQDARWRRFLVSKTNAVPRSTVLDVAAGTQLVSRELAARKNVRVVALDQSEPMLRAGGEPNRLARLDDRIAPVLARAERLPFGDDAFDAVTFTYLLRYVEDPAGTVRELARVLRPGGSIAMLEFSVPSSPVTRAGWWAHTRLVMPVLGTVVSPAWARTAAFLGPNVSSFVAAHPLAEWVRWFQEAGIRHVRTRPFLAGTAVVLWGVKGS